MRHPVLLLLFIAAASPVFCQTTLHPVTEPLLPVVARSVSFGDPEDLGFFSTVRGPIAVSEEGRKLVADSVFWSWMNIGSLGASTLSFIVTCCVDRTVGGMLSLASAGFWSVSNLATAFTHRKIANDIKTADLNVPRPVAAGVASLAAGVLGIGAVTATSLIFNDLSGAAEITAYVCFGLSAIAGGYGVFKTFEYAHAAGTDLSFF
ncbi:MAG: hypothetical protein JW852_03950 [Spirochaetales bacterium]|nr:hypothetical protein [Spirochaetales bacterium]